MIFIFIFLFNFFYIQLYMYFTFEKAYYMPTIKINSVGSSFGHFDDVILIVKAALCFFDGSYEGQFLRYFWQSHLARYIACWIG